MQRMIRHRDCWQRQSRQLAGLAQRSPTHGDQCRLSPSARTPGRSVRVPGRWC